MVDRIEELELSRISEEHLNYTKESEIEDSVGGGEDERM